MTIGDEITQDQSFTERTLKYGRNLMAAAVTIIVFAMVPVVDLAKSRPFNFEIKEGGEIWIWGILLVLLGFYAFRFFGLAFPDFLNWKTKYGQNRATMKKNLNEQIKANETQIAALTNARQIGDEAAITTFNMNIVGTQNHVREARSILNNYNWRRTYFWIADAGLPTSIFVLALWASLDKIHTLLCDLQLCQSVPHFVALVCSPDMPDIFQ